MNIVLGKENINIVDDRYISLELDLLKIPGRDEPIAAYCILDPLPLDALATVDQWRDLHENLIKNYRIRNWNYCEQALEHLAGKWGGQLDTFYQNLNQRVLMLKETDPGPEWSAIIDKT